MSDFENLARQLNESLNIQENAFDGYAEFPGCDVIEILKIMHNEQNEHLYAKMSSAYVKHRQVVVEWIMDVAEYFNLHPTTTHAAVAYLDRLQPNEKFSRYEWQMLAICCLLIAAKYNECEEHLPSLCRLEEITQHSIPNEVVLNYELWSLKRMGWKLNARTPIHFLSSLTVIGVVLPGDQLPSSPSFLPTPFFIHAPNATKWVRAAKFTVTAQLQERLHFLARLAILDLRFKPIYASAIAAGILHFARQECGISPVWSPHLTAITGHNAETDKHVLRALQILELMKEDAYATEAAAQAIRVAEADALLANATAEASRRQQVPALSTPVASRSSTEDSDSAYVERLLATPTESTTVRVDKENMKPGFATDHSPSSIAQDDL